jgi:hypothetical protein
VFSGLFWHVTLTILNDVSDQDDMYSLDGEKQEFGLLVA